MGRSKRSFDLLMLLWPLGKVQNWAARHPLLGRFIHADASPDRNRHIIIPVNRVISGTESVVLPPTVLEALVARASRHVTLNQCLCRRAEGCHTYPRDLGCLFLGDAAGQINPELGRSLAPEEALAHARQAVAQGLVPMIVHAAYDAELLGIDYDRMLAVCFCCDCCCTVRQNLRSGPTSSATRCCAFRAARRGRTRRATAAAPVSTSVQREPRSSLDRWSGCHR